MAEGEVTKIYCDGHGGNDNALAYAAMARNNNDPLATMAAMGGGMNNWMNNPFAYMMMMFMIRQFGFGNGEWGNGQNAQNVEMQNQLSAIREQLSTNQNTTLLMDAIKGNNVAIGQLASNLNCDFNSLKDCCCSMQAAIQQVAGQVGFSAERVINAVNMGDCNVIQALKDCCCNMRTELLQQSNLLQRGQDFTNRSIERGFADTAYATQKQTCDIITAGQQNTQRIIDTLNCHWNQELQQKYQDARLELSQQRQNAYLISQLKETT